MKHPKNLSLSKLELCADLADQFKGLLFIYLAKQKFKFTVTK